VASPLGVAKAKTVTLIIPEARWSNHDQVNNCGQQILTAAI